MARKTKCLSCWPTHHFKAQYNTFLLYTTSLALHEKKKKKLGCCVTTVWRCLHFLLQHVKETTQEGGRAMYNPTGWVGRLVLIGVVFRSALDTVGLLLLCLLRTFTQLLPPGNHSR